MTILNSYYHVNFWFGLEPTQQLPSKLSSEVFSAISEIVHCDASISTSYFLHIMLDFCHSEEEVDEAQFEDDDWASVVAPR